MKLTLKQFKSQFIYHVKPDHYVVIAKKNDSNIFVYYKLQDEGGNIDIRYIRENGIRGPILIHMIIYYHFMKIKVIL